MTPAAAPPPPPKLAAIPAGARVAKRPLIRLQAPSSSKAPLIYLSSSAPLASVVRRVQKQLDGSLRNATAAAPKNASLHARVAALKRGGGADAGGGTVVTLVGTGKAVDKALRAAAWFERRGDCAVRLRTRTVGTVDDVVRDAGDDESRVRQLSCLEVAVSLL